MTSQVGHVGAALHDHFELALDAGAVLPALLVHAVEAGRRARHVRVRYLRRADQAAAVVSLREARRVRHGHASMTPR